MKYTAHLSIDFATDGTGEDETDPCETADSIARDISARTGLECVLDDVTEPAPPRGTATPGPFARSGTVPDGPAHSRRIQPMLSKLAGFAAAVAAAVTGTDTPTTRAAGCRFGPDGEPVTGRRPIRFRVRVSGLIAGEWRAECVAGEWREASRLLARRAKPDGIPVGGFDGPAFRFGRFAPGAAGCMIGRAWNRDGVEVGTVTISRADGRPIRAGRKGAFR